MRSEIAALREQMKQLNIDYYIVTTTDAHNSEYVSNHDMVIKYISGFSGSNATLLVSMSEALIWTDGRYYIQCEKEIAGSGIRMMREGDDRDPSVQKYLGMHVVSEESIAFNGDNITLYRLNNWLKNLAGIDYKLITDADIAGYMWDKTGLRPAKINGKIRNHELKYSGEDTGSKIKRVCIKMRKAGCSHLFISKPDDIMWLFNIRGEDVAYNPVALSYAFITVDDADKDTDINNSCLHESIDYDITYRTYLFVNKDRIEDEALSELSKYGTNICAYEDVFNFLNSYDYKGKVMIDEREISVNACNAVCEGLNKQDAIAGVSKRSDSSLIDNRILTCVSPVTELKAVKNETEIANMKKYFLIDSLAMTQYIYTVKKIMGCDIPPETERFVENGYVAEFVDKSNRDLNFDEIKATKICDEIRCKMPECEGLSFATIAAYGANAAMMHYEATQDSYSECEPSGMLLTDCGGQYPGATTDVTRTFALGPVTDEMKHDYTLVLKGWLSLMHATWLSGCTGRNLDILARQYLWNEGIDYKCGTGHGVGYNLSVHEGPQNIRWRYIEGSSEAVLRPGMVVTNEPGVYKGGRYGIRTENTMLVVNKFESDGEQYLGFENLTWVPVDEDLIDYNLLDDKERRWLSDYQNEVLAKLDGV